MQELKHCSKCDETKPIEEFSKGQTKSYKADGKTHTYCKSCSAARAREWRKANPGYRGSGLLKSIPEDDRYLMSAIRARLSDAKGRCKKLNKSEPTVQAQELYELFKTQLGKCALTGATLVVEKGNPLCLSLDQIDPSLGYSLGNVQWVAWAVNRAKGDLSLNDFYGMCEAVLKFQKVQRLSKA